MMVQILCDRCRRSFYVDDEMMDSPDEVICPDCIKDRGDEE